MIVLLWTKELLLNCLGSITMSRAGLQQWAGLCPSLTVTPWVLWWCCSPDVEISAQKWNQGRPLCAEPAGGGWKTASGLQQELWWQTGQGSGAGRHTGRGQTGISTVGWFLHQPVSSKVLSQTPQPLPRQSPRHHLPRLSCTQDTSCSLPASGSAAQAVQAQRAHSFLVWPSCFYLLAHGTNRVCFTPITHPRKLRAKQTFVHCTWRKLLFLHLQMEKTEKSGVSVLYKPRSMNRRIDQKQLGKSRNHLSILPYSILCNRNKILTFNDLGSGIFVSFSYGVRECW